MPTIASEENGMPVFCAFRNLLLAGFIIAGSPCVSPVFAQEFAEEPDQTAVIENGFYDALSRGQASEAQALLNKAFNDRTSTNLVNIPQLMLALANHLCDIGDLAGAKPWYERLDKEFGSQIADEESQKTFHELITVKLEWINGGGKRPWARPDVIGLARELASAVAATDTFRLEQLLACVDVYVGWWQSELEPTSREDLLNFLGKHRGERIVWSNEGELASRSESAGDSVLYVNTHGWVEVEGGFTNVQLAIHRVPGGWEWRGIVLGETREP